MNLQHETGQYVTEANSMPGLALSRGFVSANGHHQ
jgi:hypothetical protein